MRYTVLFIAISFLMTACSKDKFSSTPKLTYKSVNTTVLDKGQILQFTLGFTDLEGDLRDSFLFIQKVVPQCPVDTIFKVYEAVPVFPSTRNSEGDLIVTYSYGSGSNIPPITEPQCQRNDTCYFRFVLRDQAKHLSDTVNSETIVIIK